IKGAATDMTRMEIAMTPQTAAIGERRAKLLIKRHVRDNSEGDTTVTATGGFSTFSSLIGT
ncbi:MAG: hypothetical protein OSB69_23160, partial [Alphaproteobacteria bacterium]|nr:hypothetical protein [Alphaproteobacteria bacterium]